MPDISNDAYLELLLYRLDKGSLYQAHRDAEGDLAEATAKQESLAFTIVLAVTSLEQVIADLREGPGSANYEFARFSMIDHLDEFLQPLLDMVGQEAVDKYWDHAVKMYEAQYKTTRALWEANRNQEPEEADDDLTT